ncbi:MAG: hypothetical protein ACE5Q6_02185 [Dehalococcoidia bacterium]
MTSNDGSSMQGQDSDRSGPGVSNLDIADFDAWRRSLGAEIEKRGFLNVWEELLPQIIHMHSSGTLTGNLLGNTLYTWMKGDPQLLEHLENLPEQLARQLESFLASQEGTGDGSESASHHGFIGWLRNVLEHAATDHPEIREGDGTAVKCLTNESFQNWGRTVRNLPFITCLPKTKQGVRNVVKWAAGQNKTVRVSGYRHTWSDLYSSDDQVLISLLPLDIVEDLPAREPAIDPEDQLQGIEIVGEIQEEGVTKALCRIGSATTNEQFRRWCLSTAQGGGNWQWTVPLNVIMVEITWGGSNAPICHGAGWKHRTLSDLVTEIEFVNPNGDLQVVNDQEQLKAAAGCFGLLGVVTAITLKLDPMSYAVMKPVKTPVPLTLPPPKNIEIPKGIDLQGISEEALENAWQDFIARCENDYYAEWFWFVFQDSCWVNTWKNDGLREDAKDYPAWPWPTIQGYEEFIAELMNQTIFRLIPGYLQAKLLGSAAMLFLPGDQTIVTPLIDALHFRRGIQDMRVLDMEFEIPIPSLVEDPNKPDWSVCQKAWWAVLTSVYSRYDKDKNDVPMRLTMEMRITSDSGVTMAPQYGNRFGTCGIEVLTPVNVDQEEWRSFMQEIADVWTSYTGPDGKTPLNVRPHWAKQWQHLNVQGMPINDYLKNVAYLDPIQEFRNGLQAVAEAGGFTLQDMRRMFSNGLLDEVFTEVFK